MYAIQKNGINNYLWNVINDLNKDLTANVKTKHGPTRNFRIKDSIRQGGVVSVLLYALLMDEIAKEIQAKNTGSKIPGTTKNLGCLLWMDDVVLIHNTADGLQDLLNTTDKIAKKYHIEFGKEKSKVMTLGQKDRPNNFKIGEMKMEQTPTYKYLGETINNKNNLDDHIKEIKGKAEAAFQTILIIAGDKDLRGIQMKTIWRLLDACIKPIITYACETWYPRKGDISKLNKILDNIIKRILKTPVTTPRETLYIETKILYVEHTMNRNRILMLHRLENNSNDLVKNFLKTTHPTSWSESTRKIMKEYTDNDVTQTSTHTAKTMVNKAAKETCIQHMHSSGKQKPKVEFLLQNSNPYDKDTPKYLTELCRNHTSIIFKARTRMIKVKRNFKTKYKNNLMCRGCGKEEETQLHVLQECKVIHTDETTKIYQQDLFDNSKETTKLQEMANKLIKIEEQINKDPQQDTEVKCPPS